MKQKDLTIGLLFILIGSAALLDHFFNLRLLSMSRLWPVFILMPGVSFELSFASTRRNPGILIPGGILTTIGLLFLFESYTSWHFAAYTWPVYPLSVAIGLWQFYVVTGRPKPLLIPISILTVFSMVSFGIILLTAVFSGIYKKISIAGILIVIGIIYFSRGLSGKPNENIDNNKNTGAF